jgi:hypothetical protein
MPDVEHINRPIGHCEQETICAPISRAKKQLTDGFAKRKGLRSQRTTLWVVSQTKNRSLGTIQPIIGRVRCLLEDVRMNSSEIVLCSGSQDDAVAHFFGRVSRLISSKTSLAG